MNQSKTNSKYTEDWLSVKNITNGMIELDNHAKVTGVKIKPRNIFILDSNSRNNIISQLRVFYDTIDFEFWLISADRPVDISNYLATLQIQYNNEGDPRIKKIISQDIEKANVFNPSDEATDFSIGFHKLQSKLKTLCNTLLDEITRQ